MFVSCTVFVLSGRGLCDGPIPRPKDSCRLWCVFECDQVQIKTLYTNCEQVGRRGNDYEMKHTLYPYIKVYIHVQVADFWKGVFHESVATYQCVCVVYVFVIQFVVFEITLMCTKRDLNNIHL
jgi:hypothetical protein